MSKIQKTVTDSETIFHLSGNVLILLYIENFIIKTPFETMITDQFINYSIAKSQKKIDACKCLLEHVPNSHVFFQAVDALANQTVLELRFSNTSDVQTQTSEYRWLCDRYTLYKPQPPHNQPQQPTIVQP